VVRQIPLSSHFIDSPVCARQLISPSGCFSGGLSITDVDRSPGSLLNRTRKRESRLCQASSISLPMGELRDLAMNRKQCKPE
jgi:hypothetical protein